LIFSSSSEAEKNKWLNDLRLAIENIKSNVDEHKTQYTSTLKSNGNKNQIIRSILIDDFPFSILRKS
jgi:hypothetical protein